MDLVKWLKEKDRIGTLIDVIEQEIDIVGDDIDTRDAEQLRFLADLIEIQKEFLKIRKSK